MKKYLLLSLAMVVALPSYAALDCATPPTCDDLGYTQTETDCAGKFILKCPFDNTKVFCGGVDGAAKCKAEGYTKSPSSFVSRCLIGYTLETCPYDSSYTKCVAASCEDLGYTQTVSAFGTGRCLNTQTVEYCPSDETKYKCVESATATQCKNAGYTAITCLSGCTTTTCPYDSNYMKCTNCPTLSVCPGEYFSELSDPACQECEHGAVQETVNGNTCYRCGTQSECKGTGLIMKCMSCMVMAI